MIGSLVYDFWMLERCMTDALKIGMYEYTCIDRYVQDFFGIRERTSRIVVGSVLFISGDFPVENGFEQIH